MDMKAKINKEVELVAKELETVEYENKEAFIQDRLSDFVADNSYEIVQVLSDKNLIGLNNSNNHIVDYTDVADLISDLATQLMIKEVLRVEKETFSTKQEYLNEIIIQAQAGLEEIEAADKVLNKFQDETEDIIAVFDRLQGIMTLIEKGNLIENGEIFTKTPKTLEEIEKI